MSPRPREAAATGRPPGSAGSARAEVLARIAAVGAGPGTLDAGAGGAGAGNAGAGDAGTASAGGAVPIPRDYHGPGAALTIGPPDRGGGSPRAGGPAGSAPLADVDPALLDLLVDRLTDYRAAVHRCPALTAGATIAAVLDRAGVRRGVVPDGFPADWLPPTLDAVRDDPPLSATDLDALDGVLSTCRLAVAETGTIVLDAGPGMGRRALSLVPDFHLVVVRAEQVVAGVPDAVHALEPTRPQTWISGPSATSDIELQRVEGVHGPRRLAVVLLDAAPPDSAPPDSGRSDPGLPDPIRPPR